MHEVKGFAHHTDIQILGILHNLFLILPTWLILACLSHTNEPLGHKWSSPVLTGVENLSRSLCSSIGSVLVIGIGDLSPRPRFLLKRSYEGVCAYVCPHLNPRQSSSNVHLGELMKPYDEVLVGDTEAALNRS